VCLHGIIIGTNNIFSCPEFKHEPRTGFPFYLDCAADLLDHQADRHQPEAGGFLEAGRFGQSHAVVLECHFHRSVFELRQRDRDSPFP
jgi:hypothetical protein